MRRAVVARLATFVAVGAATLALGAPTALANTWLLPSTSLSAAGQNSEAPQVAVAPSGETTVVWAQEVGSTLVIQVRTRPAGSSTFGAVGNLAVARVGSGGTAGAPQVAVTPEGDTTVVWSSYLATNYAVEARTRPAGSDTFGPAETVVSTPNWGQISQVQLAVAATGETTVVWTQRPSAGISVPPEVMARTRPAGRNDFDPSLPAQRISAAGDDANNPKVAMAPGGETTVVWDLIVPTSPGALPQNKVQSATQPAGSNTFGGIQDLSDTSNGGTAPQIAVAPSGETTVIWTRTVEPSPRREYIQARTRPAGSNTFGGVENLSPTDGNANRSRVAVAPDGATTAVWAQSVGSSIAVQARTRPAGSSAFGTTSSLGQIDSQSVPEAASAPDGAITVVWGRTAQSGPCSFVIQAATQPGRANTFGAAEDLSASGGVAPDQPLPRLAVAPNGAVTVVWIGSDLANNIVQAVSSTPTTYGLAVSLAGDGQGSVVSSPSGIDCGSACEATFNLGTRVSLAATATAGSTFTGWSGAGCSGTGSCEVAMSEARSVTATFTADPIPPPPPPPGEPKLGLSIGTPKKVKAGRAFPIKVRTRNAKSAGASAQSVRSCAVLPRGLSVVKRGSGRVTGRTICWTRSSLAPGSSVTHKPTLRSSRSSSGRTTVRGTASASNGAGTTVRTTDSSRLVVVSPGRPRFTG